jgi:hypothetical protein
MRDIREPLRVFVDKREQCPWAWEASDVSLSFHSLVAGDYAMESDCEAVRGRDTLAVRFAIERKEFNDFLGTISTGWDRFQHELDRMAAFPARVVIVEGDFSRCCFVQRDNPDRFGSMIDSPPHNHPMLTPSFVARRTAELSMMGVSVLFAGDAQLAAGLAYRIFLRRAELENMKV